MFFGHFADVDAIWFMKFGAIGRQHRIGSSVAFSSPGTNDKYAKSDF